MTHTQCKQVDNAEKQIEQLLLSVLVFLCGKEKDQGSLSDNSLLLSLFLGGRLLRFTWWQDMNQNPGFMSSCTTSGPLAAPAINSQPSPSYLCGAGLYSELMVMYESL